MKILTFMILGIFAKAGVAAEVKVGDAAPAFKVKNQAGKEFDLASRKGQWTILYFYPKAETPGCTKQACAYRDNIQKVRELGADVFGISVNSVSDQAKFHDNHKMKFDLLADENGDVTKLYGAKMPVVNMSKRWTFILDPELKVREIDKSVDPVKDVDHMVARLKELQGIKK